jgi:hypothetical protein
MNIRLGLSDNLKWFGCDVLSPETQHLPPAPHNFSFYFVGAGRDPPLHLATVISVHLWKIFPQFSVRLFLSVAILFRGFYLMVLYIPPI